MKILFLILCTFFCSNVISAETWKVEHSAILRRQVPGTPQYADTIFSSKADCERGIDDALGNQKSNLVLRGNYKCFLAGATQDAAPTSMPSHNRATTKLGVAIVNRLLSPEQTGHNIAGSNNYEEFGGKKPDSLKRDDNQFGFIASEPVADAATVKPHQLPNKNAEKVCAQMKQLSCFSTRGFIGCCPIGFSYLAAPTGMAPMGDVCATEAADKQNQQCLCFRDNADCINSKKGICYGCSEL